MLFGQLAPRHPPDLGFPIHHIGHLHDDFSLRTLYSAADALVVPSRQDNLPNTAVEAQALGSPVVAFNISGLPDIVDHQRSGYLAKPFDTEDLARGIKWVLEEGLTTAINARAREKAVRNFSTTVVSAKYINLYKAVLANSREKKQSQTTD